MQKARLARQRVSWPARVIALLALLEVSGFAGTSCRPHYWPVTVGDPCLSALESDRQFSGFDEDEVSVELWNAACGDAAICLVNHFRGRTSCPYGQPPWEAEDLPTDQRCWLPSAEPDDGDGNVAVGVRPQLEERPPDQTVYCSCRCANANGQTDDGARYCDCPPDFRCEPLFDDLGLGNTDLAGSYCIKRGTTFDETAPPGRNCSRTNENCGEPRPPLAATSPHASTETATQFIEQIVVSSVNKLDLLFVLDNSRGMAHAHGLFAPAAARLVHELAAPPCRAANGAVVPREGTSCPTGTTEVRAPLKDIHVGAISTSLGGHGGVLCSVALGDTFEPSQDDRGELIAPLRGVPTPVLPTGDPAGFLKWDPLGRADFGTADLEELEAGVEKLVRATGETGCGYEAGLEAWYRFLIDPQPPVEVFIDGKFSTRGEVNTRLLEQRSWFLRPDSLLLIVMLSNENDCSIRDDGVGWLIGDQAKHLPRGTEPCLTNPNDACCRSCALVEDAPPAGCKPLADDARCQADPSALDDPLSLRCFEQKRRFGIDFLYPWQRYVDGLRFPTVLGRGCESDADCPSHHPAQEPGHCEDFGHQKQCEYTNPLNAMNPNYPYGSARPDSSLVFIAGVVGVPWQDVATRQSLTDPDVLQFLRTTEDPRNPGDDTLADRWEVVGGDPSENHPPTDPFMVESIDPRESLGTNPVTGDSPQPVTAPAGASLINGHEYTIPQRDDLQYACTFPREKPIDCATEVGACDCKPVATGSRDRPLCQAPGTAETTTTQYYDKAYPATRYLKVLREYGVNSLVTSACPKDLDPEHRSDPIYGYGPVALHLADVVLDRLTPGTSGSCFPRALQTDASGHLQCQLVEATHPRFGRTCAEEGREPVGSHLAEVVRRELRSAGRCGETPGQTPCREIVLCRLQEATGAARRSCLADPYPVGGAGYCYVDMMQDLNADGVVECEAVGDPDCLGDPEVVAHCDPSQRRLIRFVSPPHDLVPFPNSTLFIGCTERRGPPAPRQ